MTVSRIRRWFLPTLLLLATIRCGGGDSLTLPPDGLPAAIVQLGGDAQTGVVGQRLTDTLIVRVTDSKSPTPRPVVGQKVVFQAVAGGTGAILIPDTAVTDDDGQARSVWVLGTLVGAQRVEARVINPALRTTLKTAFTATASADQPDTVFALAGDNQSGVVGSILPVPLTVVVTDQFGNPLSGLTVSWSVPPGQGSVSAATTVTSAAGQASVTRTLGPGAGAQTASAAVTGVASSPVIFHQTATAGGAASLVIARGNNPPRTAPVGFQDSIVVRLLDANGNGVPNGSITWAPAQGGSVAPALSQTDVNGYAFTFWTFGPAAGPQNVTATAAPSGLQVTISGTATASQPTTIARASGIPASYTATVGQAVVPAPSVKVTDQNSNPVQGVNVDFVVTGGNGQVSNGSVTASVVTILTNASGVATLASWTLGSVAGANTLEARAFDATNVPLGGSPIGWTATGQAGSAAQLAITSQPAATAQSGVVLATQPSVQLQDQFGNTVAQGGVVVTAAVAGGGATLRGTLTAVTNASGVASFTGLNLLGPVGSYSLLLSAPALSSATTQSISLSAGPAALLAITTQPSATAQSGVPFATQPALQVRDSAGNAVAGSFSITATLASGAGTLGGTTTVVSLANGSAAFTDLSITGASGPRTLRFSAAGLASVVSGTVTVGAGVATQLGINVQPSASVLSGSVFAQQPVLELRDASGNPVPQAGVSITATITNAPVGVTLGGATTTQTSAAGTASFAGLALTGPAGNYSLTFAVTAGATGVSPVTSSGIALTAGSGTTLTLTTAPPATGQSGVALVPATVVQLRDGSGNPAAQAGVAVVASIASGAGGTLGGTDTVLTDPAGVATFSNLVVSGPPGAYTLAFNGTGLTGVTAPAATALTAGPAARLALLTQPAPTAQSGVPFVTQPVVELQDAAGNPVSQAGVTITATIASGGGSLGGTVSQGTNANGQATYTDLVLSGTVGPRTIDFTATGLTKATSATVTLAAGAATTLTKQAGDNQTGTAGSPLPIDPQVKVTDASGNPVAGVNVTFTVTAGGGSAAAVAVTDAAGLASVTWALGTTTGTNTLDATAVLAGGSATVTFTATGQAGSAGRLAIATQPSTTAASGAVFAQQPAIQLQDALGNNVTTSGVAVTVSSSGNLGGNTTALTVNGVATFTNLSLSGLVGNYSLTFTGTNLTGVTSNSIALTPGSAAALVVVTQPSATEQSGVSFTTQPVIQVVDAAGNTVASAGRQVTAAINSGPGGTINPVGRQVTTNASGTAAFTALTLTGPVGSYTLLFSTAGLSADVSSSFALVAGPASQISASSTTSQSATVGTVVAAPPSVLVVDGAGNPVGGVTVNFAVTAGGGSLNGAIAVTDPAGVATVTSWTLGGTVGTNTVTATATGLSGSPVTFNATGTAGAATTIALNLGNNQSATVNTAVATAPSVKVTDASGNAVAGTLVTFAVTSGGGTVVPVTAVATNASGIAAVTSWTLGTAAGSNTLSATATGLTGSPVVFTATGTAGAAATLTKAAGDNQTAGVGSAVAIAPQVLVVDGFGNPKSGVSVTFAPQAGSGSVTGGTTTTNASGLATVGSWTLGATAGTNSLTATATGSGISGNPATFTATGTAGGAASVAANSVTTQSATVGTAVAAPPSVIVRDAANNPVAGATVTFAITIGTAGSLVGATQTTDGAGVATVTSWTLDTTARANNTVTATVSGSGITGNPVTFTATGTAAAAAKLLVNRQPSASPQSGVIFPTTPRIQVADQYNNAVATTPGVVITASVLTSPGGTPVLTPLTATTVSTGLATFTNFTLTGLIGSYTFQFDATAAGLGTVNSNAVTLTPGFATALSITTEPPGSSISGAVLIPAPTVQLVDGAGNAVSQLGTTITAAVASGPGGSSLAGNVVSTSASGLATFSSLALSGSSGSYTLSFTGPTQPAVTSTPIVLGAGSATKLAITTQPSSSVANGAVFPQQPVIQLQDAASNPVNQAGVSVNVIIASGGGTLGGTTTVVTNGSGQAIFTNLQITGLAGNRTLLFAASGISTATSNIVDITAGAPASIAVNGGAGQSATVGTAVPTPPSVIVRDASSNLVSGVTVTFLVASGGGSITGPTAVTGSNGIATVGSWTLGNIAGSNSLTATASGSGISGNPITFTATGTAGAATKFVITTQPSATAASGAVLAQQPMLQLQDALSNNVSQPGVSVTASASAGATLGGTVSVTTNGSGQASFTDLRLSGLVGNYTLSFASSGLTGATSNAIALGAGAATQLVMVTQPSSGAQSGIVFSQQPSVRLEDQFGNPVATTGTPVTVAIGSGGGTLGGTATVNTVSGVATFAGLSITGLVGGRTLNFTSGVLSPATSNTITLSAGAAATIALSAGDGQSATVNTAVGINPAVLVTDNAGNPVSGVSVAFLVASGGGGVTGGGATTGVNGIATVGSWTLGTTAGANSLTATSGTLGGSPVTFTATGLADIAHHLSFTVEPTTTIALATITPAVEVAVVDQFDNLVTSASDAITLKIGVDGSGSGATLSGTTTVNAVSGVATFSDLSIDLVGTGYQLNAGAAGLTDGLSALFDIN